MCPDNNSCGPSACRSVDQFQQGDLLEPSDLVRALNPTLYRSSSCLTRPRSWCGPHIPPFHQFLKPNSILAAAPLRLTERPETNWQHSLRHPLLSLGYFPIHFQQHSSMTLSMCDRIHHSQGTLQQDALTGKPAYAVAQNVIMEPITRTGVVQTAQRFALSSMRRLLLGHGGIGADSPVTFVSQ